MSQYTENYHLEKPESNDDFENFRENYNSNMDIIVFDQIHQISYQ